MNPKWFLLAMCILLGIIPSARAMSLFDFCDFDGGPPKPHSLAGYSASYDSSAVPELIVKLQSETDESRRACWAIVLGVVGDERAVEPLIASIEKPSSAQPTDARYVAMQGLGFLINRTGSAQALTYLIDGLKLDVWRKRSLQGVPPFNRSQSEYDRQLSDYALMALALSGDPRAGDALRSLQTSPTPGQALVGKDLDDMLATWLEVHRVVAERGLQGMYDYYEARRGAEQERYAEEARRKRAELYPNLPAN
jgi:hypothetical protein